MLHETDSVSQQLPATTKQLFSDFPPHPAVLLHMSLKIVTVKPRFIVLSSETSSQIKVLLKETRHMNLFAQK